MIYNSKLLTNKPKIEYEKDRPMGDKIRVLNTEKAQNYNIYPKVSLQEGIEETIQGYLSNIDKVDLKFNAFNQK